jgi:hypothetical protein
MKRIDCILSGAVEATTSEVKKQKIETTIKIGLLNAEDDLLAKQLEYKQVLQSLATTNDYTATLTRAVELKQEIADIEAGKNALLKVQADLNEELAISEGNSASK